MRCKIGPKILPGEAMRSLLTLNTHCAQYISSSCNGTTFFDARECSSCAYGTNRTEMGVVSLAKSSCEGTTFVLNECMDGTSTVDESMCSDCNANCAPANFSKGQDGQYISELCEGPDSKDNTCSKCSGRCLSYEAKPPGQYISVPCTGMTQFDRDCEDCRSLCKPGEYIAGPRCNGETQQDTTYCQKCTPNPWPELQRYPMFTQNPCTGATAEDQVWEYCDLSCMEGEYILKECTRESPIQCTACRTSCPAGFYLTGSCDGTTQYDAVQCVPCKDCARGEYRQGLDKCDGTTDHDTIECKRCSGSCREGYYAFGACTGKGSFDETACKECTVCERDFPEQYNSIYGACLGGNSTEDAVVCAQNPVDSSYLGDACPANYVAYGKLDAVDTELRRMLYGSLSLSNQSQSIVYDAIVPRIQLFSGGSPVVQNGDWMIVSKSVRDMASGRDLDTNTRVEKFKVRCLWFPIVDIVQLVLHCWCVFCRIFKVTGFF